MSAADKTKLDGIATGANNYTLPTATSTVKGGVELFSDSVQSVAANAVTTTASRTYGVQLNSDGQAVVNVPWSDTNTVTTVNNTLTSASTTEALSAAQGKALQDNKLSLAGGTMTGAITSLRETKVIMAGGSAINLAFGNLFTKTVSSSTTFTVSNVPVSGSVSSFILELTDAGAYTVTWWSGVKWAGGAAPALTASGVDVLGFYTHDGGTTWRGLVLVKDSK
jgi:hypothetical protein